MLVLSRRKGQAICIGDQIRIIVTRIDDGQVRIGIETPRDLPVLREELLQSVQSNNTVACAIDSQQLDAWLQCHPAPQTGDEDPEVSTS